MTLIVTVSLTLASLVVGLAASLIHFTKKCQRYSEQNNLLKVENETLKQQVKSIVYNDNDASRVWKKLRAKYKNS